MRYINRHTAEQIVAKMPAGYFAPDVSNDLWASYKKAKTEEIAQMRLGLTNGDYSIPPSAAKLAVAVLLQTPFDDSLEGQVPAQAVRSGKIRPQITYDDRFAEKAMRRYPRG